MGAIAGIGDMAGIGADIGMDKLTANGENIGVGVDGDGGPIIFDR
jgi:hypothetical protein